MTARILFACGREPTYIRNQLLIQHLRDRFEVDVIASKGNSYLQRLAHVLPRAAWMAGNYDVVIAGFLGQPIAAAALMLKKPIVLDAFVSIYDTLCLDRMVARPESPVGRIAYLLDKRAVERSQVVLVDTQCQKQFFCSTFGIPESKVIVHYLGPNWTDLAEPAFQKAGKADVVLHYGSFLPLHGTEIIVKAAEVLRNERQIEFRIIGHGPRQQSVKTFAQRAGLSNVRFIDWLKPRDLYRQVADATIGLGGHFAENPKARRVIAGKTFQFLAAGRPTIVGDCPANRELFVGGQHVEYVEMNDAVELARAILALSSEPGRQEGLGKAGHALMREKFAPNRVARSLELAIERAIGTQVT